MDAQMRTDVPFTKSYLRAMDLSLEIPVPQFLRYLVVALCALAWVAGVVGNILVLLAIAETKKLRTSANTFLASLAAADLSSCILILPLIAVAFVSLETITTNHLLCRLFYLTIFSFTPVSIEHLTLIAANRFILINKSPRTYTRLFSKRTIPVILTLVWVGNIVVSVAFSLSAYRTLEIGAGRQYCQYEMDNTFTLGYMTFCFLFAFLSSFVVIPALYILTFWTVHKSQVRVSQEHTVASTHAQESGSTSLPIDQTASSRNVPQMNQTTKLNSATQPVKQTTFPSRKPRKLLSSSEIRIIKVNFVIFLTNILFLLPLIIIVATNFGDISHVHFALLLLPIGLNSAVNPLVYCGFNRNFRQAFKSLLRL